MCQWTLVVRVTLENQTTTKVVQIMAESKEPLKSRHLQPQMHLSPKHQLLPPLHLRPRILNLMLPVSQWSPRIGISSNRRHRQIRSHKFSPQMDSSSSSRTRSNSQTLQSKTLESQVKVVYRMVLHPTQVRNLLPNPSSSSSYSSRIMEATKIGDAMETRGTLIR